MNGCCHDELIHFNETIAEPSDFSGAMQELSKEPDIYDKLVASIAPSIWQLEDVKKGILCQLFGGSAKVSSQTDSKSHWCSYN